MQPLNLHGGDQPMLDQTVKHVVRLRASSIDLACKCPASQQGEEASYGTRYSIFGSACHAAAAEKGRTGTFDPDRIANAFGLDDKEKSYMTYLVGSIEMNYPEGTIIEEQMERQVQMSKDVDLLVTGKADVIIPRGPTSSACTVIDYKFGKTPVNDETKQTITYIWLYTAGQSSGNSIVVQPSLDNPVNEMFYPEDAIKQHGVLLKDIAVRISERKDEFCRGSHCDKLYCPRRTKCPSYMSDMKLICNVFSVKGDAELTSYNPEMLIKIWSMKSNIEYAFTRIRDIIDSEISKNGSIETEKECLMKVLEERDVVDPEKAIPILNMLLGNRLTTSVLSITKGNIEDACSKLYNQTKQRGILKTVMDALRSGGAIEKKFRPELKFVKNRKPKKIAMQEPKQISENTVENHIGNTPQ